MPTGICQNLPLGSRQKMNQMKKLKTGILILILALILPSIGDLRFGKLARNKKQPRITNNVSANANSGNNTANSGIQTGQASANVNVTATVNTEAENYHEVKTSP